MALKAKSSDMDESLDDEDSKMKSNITRQFKKFMKNANGMGFDKDHRQSSSLQFKSQDKGKKDGRDDNQYLWVDHLDHYLCVGMVLLLEVCSRLS